MAMNDNITFLLPVRIDSEYRYKNLKTILDYYGNNPKFSFIIMEADNQPRLSPVDCISKSIRYFFIHDTNPIFHRTKYINDMLRMTETEIAAVWDVDVICDEKQILAAGELACLGKLPIVYPYDGRLWCVNTAFSELFRNRLDLSILSDFPQNRYLLSGYYSVGGGFLVNVEAYRRFGWENENFVGWGPEDIERYKRIEIITDITPPRVWGEMYHLFHTRGVNSGTFDEDLAYSTKKEFCRVCAMTKDELIAYVKDWSWIS